jgi:phospholipid/cholesterol/gamma-HCH transport system permease protein
VIGRSASVSLTELCELRASGRLRALDAMGIDPFHLLVVPRAFAMAASCFALTVAFVAATLVLGYIGAKAADITPLPFGAFVNQVLVNLGPAEYLLVALKPLLIGFVVALVTCVVALSPYRAADGLDELLPRGMAAATVAAFLVSGTLSVLL